MRYIDAEKIPWTDLNDGRGGVNVYVTFLEKVARMPAADVVEVVRCRECKHRKYGNYSKEYYCEYDAIVPYERKRNAKDSEWFCADGEKE